jgi:hypothetical protein
MGHQRPRYTHHSHNIQYIHKTLKVSDTTQFPTK